MKALTTNENAPGQGGDFAKTARLAFCYPKASTVKGRVLGDLLAGRQITHRDCWTEHGSSRLAHHILMLRQAGWDVQMTEVDASTSDGRTARIGLYSLDASVIAAAGEAGSAYVAEARAARRAGQ